MRFDWRALTCLFLAFAVFAILVSPLVPSPPTTLRARHLPVGMMVVLTLAILFSQIGTALPRSSEAVFSHAGRPIFDLTTARLC